MVWEILHGFTSTRGLTSAVHSALKNPVADSCWWQPWRWLQGMPDG